MKKPLWIIAALCLLVLLTASGCASEAQHPTLSVQAENEYMQTAIDEALDGISQQHGGPFGCVIVKDGRIVGRGHNRVVK